MNAKNVVYAVIDTNVLVSALLSKSEFSNPARIIEATAKGAIVPLINKEIINEYREVLSRKKFKFNNTLIEQLLSIFLNEGFITNGNLQSSESEDFPDPDDVVFYEVAMSVDDSFLITGNIKHFPSKPFIVTPAEMVQVLISKGLA